jgi:anti-sigma factor RsiW
VTAACRDLEVLRSLHAAGALDAADAARVEAHLAGCARCRAEVAAEAEALRLARLPPPSEATRRATATLAQDALATLRAREARAASWKRAAAGFAAAAALALVVVAPAVLGKRPLPPPTPGAAGAVASAEERWQAPDVDTLWSDAGVLDLSAASASASAASAELSDDPSYLSLDESEL